MASKDLTLEEHLVFNVESSVLSQKWIERSSIGIERKCLLIQQKYGVNDTLAKILALRNVENADEFLDPKLKNILPDPLTLTDMSVAVDRLREAIIKKEKIAIFGDYDVDGITSSALIASYWDYLSCPYLVCLLLYVGKNTNGLVCKGLFGTVCGHAVPYSFVNVENGEKRIYLHFILKEAIRAGHCPPMVNYDIACRVLPYFRRFETELEVDIARSIRALILLKVRRLLLGSSLPSVDGTLTDISPPVTVNGPCCSRKALVFLMVRTWNDCGMC